MRDLVLVSGPTPEARDRRLLAFAEWMGVPTRAVSIREATAIIEGRLDGFEPGTYCLAASAETLAAIDRAPDSGAAAHRSLEECSADLLVFDCTGTEEQLSALSRLTAGAVAGVRPLREQAPGFALPRDAASLTRQLAGLGFRGTHGDAICTFELRPEARDVTVIMSTQEGPTFVRFSRGPRQVFLASGPLPQLDEPLSSDHGLEDHYDLLIPPLVFFHHCFRDGCWHAAESTAGLIIDDPVLSDTYGLLDFGVLTRSMQQKRYGVSIAFIPWNYWRTSRRRVSRLLAERSGLTLCIHGCDHINREFASQDRALLDRRAGLALRRMESLQRRTNAAFCQVMVFPQGLFTAAAISALRANNYLAAVNSTCFPIDGGPDDLRVGDFLRPAITRYDGFPIFQRRYPRCLLDFAFDLFLGRPALAVEHHQYFRDGCAASEEFVAELNNLERTLSWPSLEAQLTRSCLRRTLSRGLVEVMFFTRRFQLQNAEGGSVLFVLSKHEPEPTAIRMVLVDGASAPFWFEQGFLRLEVRADTGQVRTIELVDRERHLERSAGFGVVHNAGVLLRRGLSEFRDNTLARHDGLLTVARGVARALRLTGDA